MCARVLQDEGIEAEARVVDRGEHDLVRGGVIGLGLGLGLGIGVGSGSCSRARVGARARGRVRASRTPIALRKPST